MTIASPPASGRTEPIVRPIRQRTFNEQLIDDFRANHGKASDGPFVGSDLLLLTTTGARSGVLRTTPLVYHRDGEDYVVVASMGGAPTDPQWYRNLVADPQVRIEVGDETFFAYARPVESEPERRRRYDDHATRYPGFAGYERKTSRRIPVVVIERKS